MIELFLDKPVVCQANLTTDIMKSDMVYGAVDRTKKKKKAGNQCGKNVIFNVKYV